MRVGHAVPARRGGCWGPGLVWMSALTNAGMNLWACVTEGPHGSRWRSRTVTRGRVLAVTVSGELWARERGRCWGPSFEQARPEGIGGWRRVRLSTWCGPVEHRMIYKPWWRACAVVL